MMYVYYGSDSVAVRTKAMALVDEKVATGCRRERVEPLSMTLQTMAEIAGSVSLFGDATVYSIDMPSTMDADTYASFLAHLPAFAESANIVVITEGVLLAPVKKRYTNHATVLEECVAPKEVPIDVFAIATALLQRDKRSMWLLYTKQRMAGNSAEEIIGILWWQLKSLRLVSMSKNATAAGMKPFVFDKTKKALQLFSEEEIRELSSSLLRVYHEGHSGAKDIHVGLEEWLLSAL